MGEFAIITTDVAIIGAGPYGLSIAAHLSAAKVAYLIFGEPMENWRTRMPKGMHLKSDGFASSLFDPEKRFTLRDYCAKHAIPYADVGRPVALATFCAYGLAFQEALVPSLDKRKVQRLEASGQEFKLTLQDGQTVMARKVVVASGISHFEWLPEELRGLPKSLCTHAAQHGDLSAYRDRDVLVLGRGASSTDIAALLVDQGARVQIVSRKPVIFHDPPGKQPRPWLERLRRPNLGLGPSGRSALYTLLPGLFRFVPQSRRQHIVRNHLGPAAVYFIRDKLEAHVPMHAGYLLRSARALGGRVAVDFTGAGGGVRTFEADHVIAGTGYRVELSRLAFLGQELISQLRLDDTSPALSGSFESSVRGLYFVGLPSTATFGPLTRFAHGAGYTARKLSAHLRRLRAAAPDKRFAAAAAE